MWVEMENREKDRAKSDGRTWAPSRSPSRRKQEANAACVKSWRRFKDAPLTVGPSKPHLARAVS